MNTDEHGFYSWGHRRSWMCWTESLVWKIWGRYHLIETRMTAATRRWFVIAPLCCVVIPLIFIPAFEWIAVSSFGDTSVTWFPLIFVFLALGAVIAFVLGSFALFFRRVRTFAGAVVLSSAAFVMAVGIAFAIGESVRMRAFRDLAERSKPLIAAVYAFEKTYGHPPESLQALVPEFMQSVPFTGMAAYPNYEYKTPAADYDDNPWVITVFTPSGGINFDQFMYFALTNYPKAGYGGTLERVGDWVYVHE